MRPEKLCGLLAESDRLAVFAAVVLGAGTVEEVRAATGLAEPTVTGAIRRLSKGGLITFTEGGFSAGPGVFKAAVRAASPPREPVEPLDPDPARDAVLRTFIRDGRLVQVPAGWRKRRLVLEYIVTSFEPGVRYEERTVDAVLRAWHPDHATLRRYLVDEELLTRRSGIYWRSGGPVLVDPLATERRASHTVPGR